MLYCFTMNTTIETNEAAAAAIAESNVIVQTSMDINNNLETTGQVKPFFATHYANAELGVCGIVALVKLILKENDAVFGRGIENSDLKHIAIATAMFTADIIEAVKLKFAAAGMRYKEQAVKNVLSTYAKGDIVKIQGVGHPIRIDNDDDKGKFYDFPRPCSKPRAKWYLVSTPDKPQ